MRGVDLLSLHTVESQAQATHSGATTRAVRSLYRIRLLSLRQIRRLIKPRSRTIVLVTRKWGCYRLPGLVSVPIKQSSRFCRKGNGMAAQNPHCYHRSHGHQRGSSTPCFTAHLLLVPASCCALLHRSTVQEESVHASHSCLHSDPVSAPRWR